VTNVTQTITIDDTIAPTASNPVAVTVECIADVPTADIAVVTDAADNCSANPVVAFVSDVSDNNTCAEVITRTYSVTDDCGNSINVVQTITVDDNTIPELITTLQTQVSTNCDNIPDVPVPGFADNCTTITPDHIQFEETTSYDPDDLDDYQIIRTWTVTDDCGNAAAFEQVVDVVLVDFVTQVAVSACYDDGTIDLDTYLSGQTGGSWVYEAGVGNANLNGSIFDPSNLENDLGDYIFSYSQVDDSGCSDTIDVTINIDDSCIVLPCGNEDVIVSTAVTPNGDQWNEFFEITGIELCGFIIDVKVFNRWGALIYESDNYQNDWNGTAHKSSIGNADKVPNGTYYYIVNLKDSGLNPITGPVYFGTK
jgi:gliding motility-associated-like protein